MLPCIAPTRIDRVVRITRDEAARSMLKDVELSDITLRGMDGTLILANRCILAARSIVFRRMLLGPFAEARKSIVDIGYRGKVLQALVEFIYLDHATFFDLQIDNEWVTTIVSLIDAANYLGIPDLCEQIEHLVASKLKGDPFLAVALLASCEYVGSVALRLESLAIQEIQNDIRVLFNRRLLSAISSFQLEKVFEQSKLRVDASAMFLLIQWWADCQGYHDCLDKATEKNCQRHQIASRLVRKHVCLDLIDPIKLSTKVAASGLVTDEQLAEAYKTQALLVHPHYGIALEKFRLRGIWQSSKDTTFLCESDAFAIERLECKRTLTCGAYKWSIKILETCSPTSLGFAMTSKSGQRKKWLYGSNGQARHSSIKGIHYHEDGHPTFTAGSIVTLCLDLTGDGTLTGSIDSNVPFVLFDDIRCDLLKQELPMDFVPVAYLKRPSKVKFMGLDVAL